MSKMSEKEPVHKSNIITFWMIVLMFALPPVVAYFMYFTGIMPDARMNNGTLIEKSGFNCFPILHYSIIPVNKA